MIVAETWEREEKGARSRLISNLFVLHSGGDGGDPTDDSARREVVVNSVYDVREGKYGGSTTGVGVMSGENVSKIQPRQRNMRVWYGRDLLLGVVVKEWRRAAVSCRWNRRGWGGGS